MHQTFVWHKGEGLKHWHRDLQNWQIHLSLWETNPPENALPPSSYKLSIYNYNKGRGKPSSSKPHTAPESVKRVKSSAQILVKSFFWRLNATNALGGSSGHQRTPFLTGIQLGLNFFGKVFCQHCDRRSASILFLTKICLILFTFFYTFWSGVSSVSHISFFYHPMLTGVSSTSATSNLL